VAILRHSLADQDQALAMDDSRDNDERARHGAAVGR
jgi:hypothetical protein